MNDKISVIVPIYNVEKYLNSCLKSICNQVYSNLEIILIDDGSTDDSSKICDLWKKKDCRIKVIHKENGGLSSARNAGIDIATGNYISFIDSDDVIHPNFYNELLKACINTNSDVAVCNFIKVKDFSGLPLKDTNKVKYDVFEGVYKYQQLINERNVVTTIACDKLYKKCIFNNLRFPIGKIHEDEFIIHHILGKTKRIVYINKNYYYYLQRQGSITKQKVNSKTFHKLEAIIDRINFFKDQKLDYYENYFMYIYCYLNKKIYYMLDKNDDFNRKKLKKDFDNYYFQISKHKLSKKEKLKLFLLKYFSYIYH